MNIMELLTLAVEKDAGDIFLMPGMPFSFKKDGMTIYQSEVRILPEEMEQIMGRIYELAQNRTMEKVQAGGEDDFSFVVPGLSGFKANIFRQRNSLAGIIRVVPFGNAMNVMELLTLAVEKDAADIFLIPGMPFSYKIGGKIIYQGDVRIMPDEMEHMIAQIYELAKNRNMDKVRTHGDDDFSFAIPGVSRFRANIFRQRGSLAGIIRVVRFELPDPKKLHLPDCILDVAGLTKGMVLVTGPAGSGKSTTLACIIDEINKSRNAHVITLEDPIEYLHKHKQSVVTQREVVTDTDSYVSGLRASLRQAPDVILLGEMRDYETISIAMTAAETGHLMLSTLHTIGAANTIDRVIDAFPPSQQQQIRTQLAMVLTGVISQQLIPTVDGGVMPAFEIMFLNNAIRNMIRESKIHQIDGVIATSQEEGMISMDNSLIKMYRDGVITRENAVAYSSNSELMERKLSR